MLHTARLVLTLCIVTVAMLLSLIAAATPPAVRLPEASTASSSAAFDALASPPLHTQLLSTLSTLSPVPIPFLSGVESLLSGDFSAWLLLSPHWWYDWLVFTWSQDPGHLALEALCLAVILYLWLRKPYDPRDQEKLSREEEEELLRSWKAEPLAAPLPATTALRHTPVIQAYSHQHLTIGGRSFLSFASFNFLGLSSLPGIKAACRQTIEKYGVGSCGPRGFYGSFDVHLEVERRLAEFLHGAACILYSDGIATLASVIPAFSKRGDLIVCDEAVNFGIQQGIRLSRSNVLYFKHNDMQDLERILSQVQEKELRHPSKLNRRFIVTEGIALHSGDISPLPHIVRLKQRYKYRLILDDTLAIGVLGATGRGSLEHWAVGIEQCDLYCASMDGALATVGGFCIGAQQIVDHQRLSGAGYCFSASSPPYTGTAAILAVDYIDQHAELCRTLREKAGSLRRLLGSVPQLQVVGKASDADSPVVHLVLRDGSGVREEDETALLRIANKLYTDDSIVVVVPEYIPAERANPPVSIMVSVTAEHEDKDLERLLKALKKAAQDVLGKRPQLH